MAHEPRFIQNQRRSALRPCTKKPETPVMPRYYFYTADLYVYDDPASAVGRRVGDYQGVYSIDDDAITPDQVFTNLTEELRKTIPADMKDTGYYHVTQFNNVT